MSENNRASVYVHINLINGKKYFGITVQEPEARWGKDGKGYSRNEHFTNAINKYGWENFAHFILYKDIPIKIAKNIEELLIREHMSYDPRFGYNKTHGGELEIPTEETRRKISKATKEVMNRPEIREREMEVKRDIMRPVEAVNPKTGEQVYYFPSTRAAGRAGFDHSHIIKCCNGKHCYKTHKGYIWRWVEEVSNNDSDNRG